MMVSFVRWIPRTTDPIAHVTTVPQREVNEMSKNVKAILAAATIACLLPAAGLALVPYAQDFEALDASSPDALANDGWLVFANVFAPDGGYLYGYGPFPAPNDGAAFCVVGAGEGGPDQGAQQLVTFSDYNNGDHEVGNLIESNVFQEQIIGADAVGQTWMLTFDAKLGNLEGGTTAVAFIKTLDAGNFGLIDFVTVDMTSIPDTWGTYMLSLEIRPDLEGQILQIGFANTATNYEGSGVVYDNILWDADGGVAVEPMSLSGVKALFD
jgi:hypothetical protein